MNRYPIKETLLLVVPAVVVPLVIVLAGQGGLAGRGAAPPVTVVSPGGLTPAELPPEPVPRAPATAVPLPGARASAAPDAEPTPGAVAASPPVIQATPLETAPAGAPATPSAAPPATTPVARGRQLARLFYTGRLDSLWAAFLPAARAEWNDLEAFRAYRRNGLEAYGAEVSVLKEEVRRAAGLTYYLRTSTFERGPRVAWTTIVGMNPGGRVQAFGIVEASLLPGAEPGEAQGQTER